jgi:hypothetical protein
VILLDTFAGSVSNGKAHGIDGTDLIELERTRNEFEFDLSACVNTRDSEREIERRMDEETIREHALSQQRRHSNGNDKEGNEEEPRRHSQDLNAPTNSQNDEKNATERQFSAGTHDRSNQSERRITMQEFEQRNIQAPRRNQSNDERIERLTI